MRIRFQPNGSADCPLLALTDLEPTEVGRLLAAISELAQGSRTAFSLHEVLGVAGDVRLRMELSVRDAGVVGGPREFVCRLTGLTWHQVAGLLEPFTVPAEHGAHQWLDESGAIRLLIAPSGTW